MPHLTCPCGEVVDLSQIPNPQSFKLLWEPSIEPLVAALVEAHQESQTDQEFEKATFRAVYSGAVFMPLIVECPGCGRVAVFAHASDDIPAFWLKREEGGGAEARSLRSLVETGPA